MLHDVSRMIRVSNPALIVLSLSPVVVPATWVLGTFVLDSPGVSLCGAVVVFGPLLLLAVNRDIRWRRGVRPLLWMAVSSGLLLFPAVGLALATEWMHVTDPGPRAIVLQPAGSEYQIRGLNVRWPPTISKLPPGAGATFGGEMSHRGGSSGYHVPGRIEDGYGNHVDFSEPRPGILHVEDNAGGFAHIDWTAAAPVLIRSQAVERTEDARGPTPFARRAVGVGQTLLFATPFLGLLLLTVALVRQDRTAALVWVSLVVQAVGMLLQVVLLVLVWTGSGRGGEAGLGMAMLVIIAAIPTAAVTLFGAGMLAIVLWGMVGSLE